MLRLHRFRAFCRRSNYAPAIPHDGAIRSSERRLVKKHDLWYDILERRKRVNRYNSSLLDANLTHSGSSYDVLNEAYIIFITENDVLKAGLPIYHIHRMVEETGAVFNDQSHIIYVNSQIKDETALGKLMHDFFCTDAKDMFYPVLANRVQYFKQDAKGVATMCRAMEEMRNETVRERNIEIAKTMLASKKLSYEDIALFSGLTVDEVKSLDTKKPA